MFNPLLFQKFFRLRAWLFTAFIFFTPLIFADSAPPQFRLRDPHANKTKCGLYLTALSRNSMGALVAEPNEESVRKFFESNPDLKPRLLYVNRSNSKIYTQPDELKAALAAGEAEAVVDPVELVWVGLPPGGKIARELTRLTKDLSRQEASLKIKSIWRPNAEMSSRASYLLHELRYVFPSIQLDYQKPLPSERSAAYGKLLVGNGSQQAFLFLVTPPLTAAASGAMNFANSYVTGVYRRFFSNWFNRSSSSVSRWSRNLGLSSFFTSDMYWASEAAKGNASDIARWERTSFDPTTGEEVVGGGWKKFLSEKWSTVLFQLMWRYYYQQGIIKWEKSMEERGRSLDARRTAGRLEFAGTFLTTPAWIYSTLQPSWVNLTVGDTTLLSLNGGSFFMLGVGALGALYYYNVPTNPRWYLDAIPKNPKWYMRLLTIRPPREGWEPQNFKAGAEPKRLTWDPWVERLDKVYAFNISWAKKLGLMKATAFMDRAVGLARSVSWNQGSSEERSPLVGDVRQLIDMDHNLLAWLEQDPELRKMIAEDPRLRRMIERDSHFDEVREELLGRPTPNADVNK